MNNERDNAMNIETLTEYDISFELTLTDEEGVELGTVQVPAITRSDLICYLVRTADQGIKIRPIAQ